MLQLAVKCGLCIQTDSDTRTQTNTGRGCSSPQHNSEEREEKIEKPKVRHVHTWGKAAQNTRWHHHNFLFLPRCHDPRPHLHTTVPLEDDESGWVGCRRLLPPLLLLPLLCCYNRAFLRMFSPNMAADLLPPGLQCSSTAPPGRHDFTPIAFPIINN